MLAQKLVRVAKRPQIMEASIPSLWLVVSHALVRAFLGSAEVSEMRVNGARPLVRVRRDLCPINANCVSLCSVEVAFSIAAISVGLRFFVTGSLAVFVGISGGIIDIFTSRMCI